LAQSVSVVRHFGIIMAVSGVIAAVTMGLLDLVRARVDNETTTTRVSKYEANQVYGQR
jgi:hypothetical protein